MRSALAMLDWSPYRTTLRRTSPNSANFGASENESHFKPVRPSIAFPPCFVDTKRRSTICFERESCQTEMTYTSRKRVTVKGKGGRRRLGSSRHIRLSDEHWEISKRLGDGQATVGIRRALDRFRVGTEKKRK